MLKIETLQRIRKVGIESIIQRTFFDAIFVNSNDYINYKNSFYLISSHQDEFINVVLKPNDNVPVGKYFINSTLANRLIDNDAAILYRYKDDSMFEFNNVKSQILKDIQDDYVSVNTDLYKKINNLNIDYFILYNKNDFSHMIIKTNHIKESNNISSNEIRLNRKQRLLLNIDQNADVKKVQTGNSLNGTVSDNLVLLPINDKYGKKNIGYKLLNFYVGKVNCALIVKRPLDTDENFNIVRISKNNMQLLGISNMDILNIEYKNKKVKARALELSDINSIISQNSKNLLGEDLSVPNENLMICIPAFVRKRLEIPSTECNVVIKVERDMKYIWDKNISKQILPIILVLFSGELFSNINGILQSIIFSFLALPIVLYFNLSSERMVAKKI